MIQPHKTPSGDETLHTIGCVGRVTSFTETDDGRYMISLTGISRFRIQSEEDGFAPYRRAVVSWNDFATDMGKPETDPTLDRPQLIALLERYFAAEELETDWEAMKSAEDELLINSLSMLCPLAPEDKQALLEAPSLMSRRETLVTLLEFAMHMGAKDEVRQ
jgi:Lon protease-like protein